MIVRVAFLEEKKLVGKRLTMSFANYNVADLWKSFIPGLKEISNKLSTELISLAVYKPTHFTEYKPTNEFDRWAAIEVADLDNVPAGMESLILPRGNYAVFIHKGDAKAVQSTFRNIYNVWLPDAGYTLDDRPHFEVLGEKYKSNDPNSQEEIWIPIKAK